MNAKKITLILIPINIILAFLVYNSIDSEVEFNQQAKKRIAENVQKLKDLRTLQIAFKIKHVQRAGLSLAPICRFPRRRSRWTSRWRMLAAFWFCT